MTAGLLPPPAISLAELDSCDPSRPGREVAASDKAHDRGGNRVLPYSGDQLVRLRTVTGLGRVLPVYDKVPQCPVRPGTTACLPSRLARYPVTWPGLNQAHRSMKGPM